MKFNEDYIVQLLKKNRIGKIITILNENVNEWSGDNFELVKFYCINIFSKMRVFKYIINILPNVNSSTDHAIKCNVLLYIMYNNIFFNECLLKDFDVYVNLEHVKYIQEQHSTNGLKLHFGTMIVLANGCDRKVNIEKDALEYVSKFINDELSNKCF